MRKIYKKILTSLLLVLPAIVSFAHVANGSVVETLTNIGAPGRIYLYGLESIVASLLLIIQMLVSWLLSVAGVLLNVGMFLTTHIGVFLKQAPVIYEVWTILRDISSLLLIFFILWAALKMVLNMEDAKVATLIKNIVIVGILINFSFFATQIMIDASNVVSLQFYNAIMPTNTASTPIPDNDITNISKIVPTLLSGGGLSNVISGSLRISAFWGSGEVSKSWLTGLIDTATGKGNPMLTTILSISGIIVVEIMLIISFFVIAIACIWRLAMLIFLLAFSPVWVASFAMPKLKEMSNIWWNQFYAQLIWLPVYLGFMYIALTVVTKSHLSENMLNSSYSSQGSGGLINLFVGFSIIFVMLNIPMVAAMTLAGSSTKWMGDWNKKINGTIGGYVGRKTLGRVATGTDKWLGNTRLGNSLFMRDVRGATIGKVASGKYGGSRSFAETKKEQKEVDKKGKEIDRRIAIDSLLREPGTTATAFRANMKNMSPEEKIELGADNLKKTNVLKALTKEDFEAISKPETTMKDSDKKDIEAKRIEALRDAVNTNEITSIKHMVNNMSDKDLLKIAETHQDLIKKELLVDELTIHQLDYINKNGVLDQQTKTDIYNAVTGKLKRTNKKHPAHGWITKQTNEAEWI